ncbi:MAG: ferrochelatase, partial [Pseudomonadota bacterium]
MNEAVIAPNPDLVRPGQPADVRPAAGPLPNDHPPVVKPQVGALLINLGTPSGTDYLSMRRYLNEFLSDPRVIELPRWIWLPLLRLVILSKRPQRSGEAYAAIWNKEKDESPLRTFTRAQAEKLQERLSKSGIAVEWGMRYGEPSIAESLERLQERGCRRIVLMALYPQYSASTMATAYDKAFDALKTMRWQPAIRTMPPYHDHAGFVRLIARSIDRHLASLAQQPDKVVMSFHGLPRDYLLRGDPYHCHCQKTARLVQEE